MKRTASLPSRKSRPVAVPDADPLVLFVMIASGVLFLLCAGSLIATAAGFAASTIFGSATTRVAIGSVVVFSLALWYHERRARQAISDPSRSLSSVAAGKAEPIPTLLALFQKVIHYPAWAAGVAGVAMLLGDEHFIERHTHSEPWATKLAGLAVVATAAFALLAAKRLQPSEHEEGK